MAAPKAPAGLGARGRRLWRELHAERVLTAGAKVLAEEACRTADRLDRLDAILLGKSAEWIDFRELTEGSGELIVNIEPALDSARKLGLALKAIVTEIRQSTAGEQAPPEADVADELQKKREARLAAHAQHAQ